MIQTEEKMSSDAKTFYNDMANFYHLIASDWDSAVKRQGATLAEFFKKEFEIQNGSSVLDCSCGIGTQAIGLALLGYDVLGTDISEKEVERAKVEAERLNTKASFKVADFRELDRATSDKFDVVFSFDNAIAHLNDVPDLTKAIISMKNRLGKNGILMLSVRDYDQIRKVKPQGMSPRLIDDENGRRIYFQTWEWNEAGDAYNLSLFILKPDGEDWRGKPIVTRMRAFTGDEIKEAFTDAGFSDVYYYSPEQSGYYQSIFAARD